MINRQTRIPITLTWQRGLDHVIQRGTPSELMLAMPYLPAMLATARYTGSMIDAQRRTDVLRIHGFTSAFAVAGHRVEILLTVRENRQHQYFLDGVELNAAVTTARRLNPPGLHGAALKSNSAASTLHEGGNLMSSRKAPRVVDGPAVMEPGTISRGIAYEDERGVTRRLIETWLPGRGWTPQPKVTRIDYFMDGHPAKPEDMRKVGMTDEDIARARQIST